jgi:hypothetical protein
MLRAGSTNGMNGSGSSSSGSKNPNANSSAYGTHSEPIRAGRGPGREVGTSGKIQRAKSMRSIPITPGTTPNNRRTLSTSNPPPFLR